LLLAEGLGDLPREARRFLRWRNRHAARVARDRNIDAGPRTRSRRS
jgi:hypothetical protein